MPAAFRSGVANQRSPRLSTTLEGFIGFDSDDDANLVTRQEIHA